MTIKHKILLLSSGLRVLTSGNKGELFYFLLFKFYPHVLLFYQYKILLPVPLRDTNMIKSMKRRMESEMGDHRKQYIFGI